MFEQYDITASVLRDRLVEALARVELQQKRMLISRRGRDVAALVTVQDFERLQDLHQSSVAQKELEHQLALEAWRRAGRVGVADRGVLIR